MLPARVSEARFVGGFYRGCSIRHLSLSEAQALKDDAVNCTFVSLVSWATIDMVKYFDLEVSLLEIDPRIWRRGG